MVNLVPKIHQKKIPEYYYKMMISKDKKIRKKFTLAWAIYEESISKLKSSEREVKQSLKKLKFESFSIIELHYLTNHCFLLKDYILKNTHRIKDIPISIVHGRYDHVEEQHHQQHVDQRHQVQLADGMSGPPLHSHGYFLRYVRLTKLINSTENESMRVAMSLIFSAK